MSEMHLKQPGFAYSVCGPFTKNKKRIQKFKEIGDSIYVYRNEPDKACFEHDMSYEDFKDLARRTALDKVLRDKSFNIAKNPKYDGFQRDLVSMIYKCFDKKSASLEGKSAKSSGFKSANKMNNKQNCPNQLLENLKKEKYIQHLKTILGVLILQICN